jgi:hypothetical protein
VMSSSTVFAGGCTFDRRCMVKMYWDATRRAG